VTSEDTGPARPRRSWPQRLLRALVLLVLALVVLYALFFHIFPWVERQLEDPTLDAAAATIRTG
jgi:hypothetical protein